MSLVEDISFGVLNQKYDAAIVDSLRFGVCLKCSSQPQRETFGTFILGKIQVFGLKWALEKSVVVFRKKSVSNKSRGRRRGSKWMSSADRAYLCNCDVCEDSPPKEEAIVLNSTCLIVGAVSGLA